MAGLHLTIADLKGPIRSSILANAPAITVRLASCKARRHTGAVDSTKRQLTTEEINLLLASRPAARPGNVRLRKSLKKENRPQIKAGACLDGNPHTSYLGPFGEPLCATGPMADSNPYRFSTKYQDSETGLLYYGYRYYSASNGRWLSRDPIAENGGPNLAAFTDNNPVTKTDVLGKLVWSNKMVADWTYNLPINGEALAKTKPLLKVGAECDCAFSVFGLGKWRLSRLYVEFSNKTDFKLFYSSQAKSDFARAKEQDHYADNFAWALGTGTNLAQSVETAQKAIAYLTQAKCEEAAKSAAEAALTPSLIQASEASRKHWDDEGFHTYHGQ